MRKTKKLNKAKSRGELFIMKKKFLAIVTAALIGTTACASVANAASGTIDVISREDGSGTRGAFIELFGIEEKQGDEKVDMTTEDASITNSTSVMMTTVSGDENAIGYISLGSLNDTVKAVKIDGAEASAENVANDTYKVSRPFNIVTGEKLSDAAQDFENYIMSADGQQIVEDNGYIKVYTSPVISFDASCCLPSRLNCRISSEAPLYFSHAAFATS